MKVIISFIIIFIFSILLYLGWEKWFVSTPQQLPQESAIASGMGDRLIQGVYYETSVSPAQSDWHSSANYRLWIPNGVKEIRGLIVMQHGCGSDAEVSGLDHANDLQWQALALKHQFALLGSKVSAGSQPCEFWAFPSGGSESTFLQAIRSLGQISRHLELETVPWVLRGHSGGAEWIAYMFAKYSRRTIAAVAMRGGGFLLVGADPSMSQVPVFFVVGENDPFPYDCVEVPKQVFLRQRKKGAVWSFASSPKTAHEVGNTRFLAIPYLDAVIAERLNSNGELVAIAPQKGWLGNLTTHEISSASSYTGNPLEAAWLPNEDVARKWKEYVTTGNVLPTRKPAAPTNVQVLKKTDRQAVITWNFTPDLENGLPSFHIYRNNSLVATVKGQDHGFGDAPDPVNVFLEYLDKNAQVNASYTVAAFNAIGESVSSATKFSK
jgi:pimeloyl-ACP methyl ester carboxylesterase